MSNKDHSKPLMLYVAELIYLEVVEIKKRNPNITNIVSIEMFIGSKTYNEISSGKFHDNLFQNLKENDFINQETGIKIPRETLDLLNLQKKQLLISFQEIRKPILQKVHFHYQIPKMLLIFYGECVRLMNCGAKK